MDLSIVDSVKLIFSTHEEIIGIQTKVGLFIYFNNFLNLQ